MQRIKTKWQLVDPYDGDIYAEFRSYKACAASIDAAYEKYLDGFTYGDPEDADFVCDNIVGIATVPKYNMDIKKRNASGLATIWYTTPEFKLLITAGESKRFYLRYEAEHLREYAQWSNAKGFTAKEYAESECKYLFEAVEEIKAYVEGPKELVEFIIKDMKKFLTKDMGLRFKH